MCAVRVFVSCLMRNLRQQQAQMSGPDFNALYRREIRQWSNQIMKGYSPEEYFCKFMEHIRDASEICITYDQRMEQITMKMLVSFAFQVYTKDIYQTQSNSRRRVLFQIIEVLRKNGFISKQGYHFLVLQKDFFLKNKLKQFLEILQESQPGKAQIQCLWESMIRMDMLTFWNLMNEKGIKDVFLLEVYVNICKCDSVLHDEPTLTFVQSIERKALVVEDSPPLIKVASIRSRNTEKRREVRNPRSEPVPFSQPETAQITKLRESYKVKKQRLYEQIWFNTGKYKKYKTYIQDINTSTNIVEVALIGLAFDEALFFNENHKQLLCNIHSFIKQVQKRLQNYKIVSYQFFGSIRSTLALASEFDIDLTSIRSTSIRGQAREQTRQIIVNTLFSIRRTLLQTNPDWVSRCFVYNFENIKVPFLKIQFQKERLLESFHIVSLEKIDITIGNKSAIKNSEMISYFARIPEVALFCLLVKLWAKTNNIINAQTPMKGLSSYGVVLMCLYFLMDSGQIAFLEASQDFDFEKEEMTPNFDSCKMRNIEQNFNGFLHFYKQTGVFQRERKVICLLKKCKKAQEMFNQDIIFNMYDFIDKTNPGRLRLENKSHIFEQIDKALKVMRLRNVISISQLIIGLD